jgi:hypothetical protein
MSLRFSGGPYANYTFTQSTGTRLEIMQGLQYALTLAGWTTISSSTSIIIMQTQTTPESLAMRIKIYDPGSGSTRVDIMNVSQALTSGDCWLTPAANKIWRVVACPYQFFIYTQMSMYNACEFVAAGTPALPPWLVGYTTQCGWIKGNSNGDGGGWTGSFRTELSGFNADYYSHWSGFWNHQYIDRNPANEYYRTGDMTLVTTGIGYTGTSTNGASGNQGRRWVDNTLNLSDPLIGWGASAIADEARIMGQLWDCAIASDAFAADLTVTIGTHNGITMTSSNTGSTASPAGTLIVCYS